MEDQRRDPEQILCALNDEEKSKHLGKLKIFFGYSAGVGKTYAMLEEAQALKKSGVDIVIGYVEPHQRVETIALMKGLPRIPPLEMEHGGARLYECDIDSVIKRRPKIVLVDELAHTNTKNCRHAKRYQDVEEILRMGIDVYTTVNVQHIEGLHDVVESITGVAVRERVPDKVFDSADKVELVDIEPDDLIARLNEGKVYKDEQAKRALTNFFIKDNLVALREIALRRTADRVNIAVEKNKTSSGKDSYFTGEHVMMCLSSSPSNAKVVRTAAKMAEAFHGSFSAVFVETSSFATMSAENKKRLQDNLRLAEQLKAKVVTVYGEDVPFHMAEYAKASGVSKIVLGRPAGTRIFGYAAQNYVDKLTAYAPNIDVYVIPNSMKKVFGKPLQKKSRTASISFSLKDAIRVVMCLFAATVMGFIFQNLGFDEANIIAAYILASIFIAVFTEGKLYWLAASLLSVISFKFFFTEPFLTFKTHDDGYIATFAVMFFTTLTAGALTKKIKEQATQSASKSYRTDVLFETSQKLQQAKDKNDILLECTMQIKKLLGRPLIAYPVENGELISVGVQCPSDSGASVRQTADEFAVAQWVYANNKSAGASTDTLSGAQCLYMPVGGDVVFAVIGVAVEHSEKLESFEKSLFMAILSECALALEKEQMREVKNEVLLHAQSEQLRSNLLRSISHDLRTPLTGIAGGSGFLLENIDSVDKETLKSVLSDISEDALWLSDLVETLLHMTRIQDGKLTVTKKKELADELISSAVSKVAKRLPEKKINIKKPDTEIFVPVDAQLIMQVIINLIDNSFKHAKSSGYVEIYYYADKQNFVLQVKDNGGGIDESLLDKIFEPFFTSSQIGDKQRGMGLGLSICKSIIEAHGGKIKATNNDTGGATFKITLPLNQ